MTTRVKMILKLTATILAAVVLSAVATIGYVWLRDRAPAPATLESGIPQTSVNDQALAQAIARLNTQIQELKASQQAAEEARLKAEAERESAVAQAREAAEEALKKATEESKAQHDGIIKAVEIIDSRGNKYNVPGTSGEVVKTESGAKLFRLKGASHMPDFTWKSFGRGIEFPVTSEGLVILGIEGSGEPPYIQVKTGYVWKQIKDPRYAGPFAGYVSRGILWGIVKESSANDKSKKSVKTTDDLIKQTAADAKAEDVKKESGELEVPQDPESPVEAKKSQNQLAKQHHLTNRGLFLGQEDRFISKKQKHRLEDLCFFFIYCLTFCINIV